MATKRIQDAKGHMHSMLRVDLGAAAAMEIIEGLERAVRTLIDTQIDGTLGSRDYFHAHRMLCVLHSFAMARIGDYGRAAMLTRELSDLTPIDSRGRKVSLIDNGPRTLCTMEWMQDVAEAA